MRGSCKTAAWLSVLLALSPAATALADVPVRGLPVSVIAEALEDPLPTAFSPADFSSEDFSIERSADGDPGITAEIEVGSVEWVRTAAWVVVPRAVVVVTVHGGRGGVAQYAGATHRLARASQEASDARVLVPVVLIAGATHPVRVQSELAGKPVFATFTLRFSPRPENRGRVMFDTRCSPFGLHVGRGAIAPDSWLYVGCNNIVTQRDDHDSAMLGLYLLWDQAGEVRIDDAPLTPARDDVLYVQHVSAGPGASVLSSRGQRVELVYALPEPLRAGFLGIGIGPYYYQLKDDRNTHTAGVPMLTLYGGYVVNPTMRVVYFNAATLDRRGYMDQGVYLSLEQLRFLDERLSMNLLLGANALIYSRHNGFIGRFSAPQGFELVFRDFLVRNRNVTAGAFLYPEISHRSYYNLWLRWGSGAFFGELNFIAWEKPNKGGPSKSQSLGISFGMPLARFFRFL